MERTRHRPVATGRVSVAAATAFGLALNVIAAVVLLTFTNVLTTVLAIGGSAFYVVIYTMLLKRRTPQNIVIGGAAGAIPPLAGWAAVTGEIGLAPLIMFLIIFLWTPPHFWALAILKKDEYARAGVPMLPVGRDRARDGRPDPGLHRDPGRRIADPGLHRPARRACTRSRRSRSAAASSCSRRRLLRTHSPLAARGDVPVLAAVPGAAVRRHGRRPRHRRYLIVRSRSDSTNVFGCGTSRTAGSSGEIGLALLEQALLQGLLAVVALQQRDAVVGGADQQHAVADVRPGAGCGPGRAASSRPP